MITLAVIKLLSLKLFHIKVALTVFENFFFVSTCQNYQIVCYKEKLYFSKCYFIFFSVT